MNRDLLGVAVAGALSAAPARGERQPGENLLDYRNRLAGMLNEPHVATDVVKTTVDVRIEVQAVAGVPVAGLVVDALCEFLDAMPTAPTGKFESEAGLDVTWSVKSELVS